MDSVRWLYFSDFFLCQLLTVSWAVTQNQSLDTALVTETGLVCALCLHVGNAVESVSASVVGIEDVHHSVLEIVVRSFVAVSGVETVAHSVDSVSGVETVLCFVVAASDAVHNVDHSAVGAVVGDAVGAGDVVHTALQYVRVSTVASADLLPLHKMCVCFPAVRSRLEILLQAVA